MKKALCMTWFNSQNYGTLLQAYATKQIFQQRYDIKIYFAKYIPKGKRDVYTIVKKFFTLGVLRKYIVRYYRKYLVKKHGIHEKYKLRQNQVERFISGYSFANEGNEVRTENDFIKLGKEFPIYISGSDQIWNPQFINERFLLNFVTDSSKQCISFASSLSADCIPEKKRHIYKKELKKYAGITIREPECAEQLSQLTGKFVNAILDPTLLYGGVNWRQYEKSIKPVKNYMLVYLLGESMLYRQYALSLASKCGLMLYHFPQMRGSYTKADELMPDETALWDVSPFEWLSWIRNADIIVTDSFHMTAFSVMFHKNFYVVEKDQKNKLQNNRIMNLLRMVHLENRFVQAEDLQNISGDMPKIDWENIDVILECERKKSYEIVDHIMEGLV